MILPLMLYRIFSEFVVVNKYLMKIAIIGSARSRSTALTEIVRESNTNLKCLYEFYTYGIHANKSIASLTKEIMSRDNVIVKLLGHNFKGEIDDFSLTSYDIIYLIERHNFLEQCCSLQICVDTQIWLARFSTSKYQEIKLKKFTLHKNTIVQMAKDIKNYLTFKKFVTANSIPHEQRYYESITFNNKLLIDPKLNYKALFIDYAEYESLNNIFSKYFDYTTYQNDYTDFELAIDNWYAQRDSTADYRVRYYSNGVQ